MLLIRGIIVALLIEAAFLSAVLAVIAPYGAVFVVACVLSVLGLAALLEPEFTE